MKFRIIAVGRMKAGPERALIETYLKRLTSPIEIIEVEARKGLGGPALIAAEAKAIGKALGAARGQQPALVALDERGMALSSRDFAQRLKTFESQGVSALDFIIGGADGLSEELKASARMKLSLGAMTWPHLLARVMLVEQLYRAQTILAGHPYHRD
jgi:23S rRNA (pseudouridine1915-N3)-methyltransferase